ncbi:MAG TPA: nitronate monooxygenase [Bacillus sp. (in: firmicutes)]|uniref:NAD(P)H-dependent flavin oxidoreductase n=1 Tax=Bacillus litorisediminis TaxID=2922713 RepID=UPI001FAE2F80|nr:nitronate monooxygenase [Bacillus litorisediminis]HWO78333.1 nitronate monooxygenase [Bacillus sp. (in: firmicutes)]
MNELCRLLDIQYPIIQGGMGNISHPVLTAAVSNAGGLGTLGVGTMTPKEIETKIIETKQKTDKPFSVNIPIQVSTDPKAMIKLVIEHQIPAVTLSAGNPAPYIPKLHEHGIKVLVVVGNIRQAAKAVEAGADVIIGEGFEAAGINSPQELTTLTLVQQLTEAVSVPIVAAGGISNGRGLAAMMMLGAQGVQMGTRFVATKDAPFSSAYKEKILRATDHCTVVLGRKVGRVRRVLKTAYAESLLEKENENLSLEEWAQLTSEEYHIKGAIEGNEIEGFMNSGQIAAIIHDLPSVDELLQTMMQELIDSVKKINEKLQSSI